VQPWFSPKRWLGGATGVAETRACGDQLAFDLADILEQGLVSGLPSHLEEQPQSNDVRTLGMAYVDDNQTHVLIGEEDQPLLIAAPRSQRRDRATSFDLFVPDGEGASPGQKPAYRLVHDKQKSSWELRSAHCLECEAFERYQCRKDGLQRDAEDLPRTLLRVRQEVVTLGPCGAKVPVMHVELPHEGVPWCEACSRRQSTPKQKSSKCERGEGRCITTRLPKWNKRLVAPTLDYGGRCQKASVRNFQMTFAPSGECDLGDIVLMFGKVEAEVFFLECKEGLSPVQAFALALTTAHWGA